MMAKSFQNKNEMLKYYREEILPDVANAATMGWPLSHLELDPTFADMAEQDYERARIGEDIEAEHEGDGLGGKIIEKIQKVAYPAMNEIADAGKGALDLGETYAKELALRMSPMTRDERSKVSPDEDDFKDILTDVASGLIDEPMQTLTDPGRFSREPIAAGASLFPVVGPLVKKGIDKLQAVGRAKKGKQLEFDLPNETSDKGEIAIEQTEKRNRAPYQQDIEIVEESPPHMNDEGDMVAAAKVTKIKKPKSAIDDIEISENEMKSMEKPADFDDDEWAAIIDDLERQVPEDRMSMMASSDEPPAKPIARIPLKKVPNPAAPKKSAEDLVREFAQEADDEIIEETPKKSYRAQGTPEPSDEFAEQMRKLYPELHFKDRPAPKESIQETVDQWNASDAARRAKQAKEMEEVIRPFGPKEKTAKRSNELFDELDEEVDMSDVNEGPDRSFLPPAKQKDTLLDEFDDELEGVFDPEQKSLELDIDRSPFEVEDILRSFLEEPTNRKIDVGMKRSESVADAQKRAKRLAGEPVEEDMGSSFKLEEEGPLLTSDDVMRSLGTQVKQTQQAAAKALGDIKGGKKSENVQKQTKSLLDMQIKEVDLQLDKIKKEADMLRSRIREYQGMGGIPNKSDVARLENLQRQLPAYQEASKRLKRSAGMVNEAFGNAELDAVIDQLKKG